MQRRNRVEILPRLKTEVFSYNRLFPGPTIEARQGRRIVVEHVNHLNVPTSVHHHGAYVDGDSDGHPADLIQPGRRKRYVLFHNQTARTMWYHDHAQFITALNVYRGLAGFFILRDAFEDDLIRRNRLPNRQHDIPLVIQDRLFNSDGSLDYPAEGDPSSNGVFGNVLLVNGKPQPRLAVATRKYRLRVLNGSNARRYELALSNGAPFTVIASEGGMFARPLTVTSLPIGQAERYEIIVDFSGHAVGDEVMLFNLRDERGPVIDRLMRFDVVRRERDNVRSIPRVLRPENAQRDPSHPPVRESDASTTRTFRFSRDGGEWKINGETFAHQLTGLDPKEGDTEIWEFTNSSGGWSHPIHLHLLNFRMLDRNGRAPEPWERGWKETADLAFGETIRVLMKWPRVPLGPPAERGRFPRTYVFHCHNLEHEDHDMMLQFNVRKA